MTPGLKRLRVLGINSLSIQLSEKLNLKNAWSPKNLFKGPTFSRPVNKN